MIYTLDTEFLDHGRMKPIDLISLGIVAEDGRTWYGVNKEFSWSKLPEDHWLKLNVLPKLDDNPRTLKTPRQMRGELWQFFERDQSPELWGYFADWDWLLFLHIFGTMLDGPPPQFPQICLDVEQYRRHLGLSKMAFPAVDETKEHNALYDAQWTMTCLKMLRVHDAAQRRSGALFTGVV